MRNAVVKSNKGQGIFPARCVDNAFINVRFEKKFVSHQLQMQGETSNILFKDCYFAGTNTVLRPDKGFFIPDGERIVFEDTPASSSVINNPQVEYRVTQENP